MRVDLIQVKLFLPNDRILTWSKLKAFTNIELNITEILKFVPDRLENNAAIGESADWQIWTRLYFYTLLIMVSDI